VFVCARAYSMYCTVSGNVFVGVICEIFNAVSYHPVRCGNGDTATHTPFSIPGDD